MGGQEEGEGWRGRGGKETMREGNKKGRREEMSRVSESEEVRER